MEELIWKICAEKHVDIYPQLQGHSFQKQCMNCTVLHWNKAEYINYELGLIAQLI